jgi:CHAT domain-containing protein
VHRSPATAARASPHAQTAGSARVDGELDASRLAALEIDTVYLAACTTHVGGRDYDEVLSLAIALLAAGARTVFGSLWRVPDEATSLLMYLVHHHVTIDGYGTGGLGERG